MTRSPWSVPARSGSQPSFRRQLYSPSHIIAIDLADAVSTRPSSSAPTSWSTTAATTPSPPSQDLTGGLGADVAIEAVGVPASFELCTELVRPGGHVANIGVHGQPATLHLETLWTRDVTITTGLVDTYSTPTLLRLVAVPSDRCRVSSPPIIFALTT